MRSFALCVLLTAQAGATRLDEIRARGKLVVSVKNDAERPHKDPAHAQKRGFELELANALARRIVGDESKLELRLLPRPTRLPMLVTGAVDLVLSMIPVTADNARQCDFSRPYFSSGLSLLVRDGARPLRIAELAGRTVAFRKQSYNDHGAELLRLAPDARVRYYPTLDAAAEAVRRGEAVAVGGNFVDLDAWRGRHAGFQVNAGLLDEQRVAVAVKKGEPELLALVNQTLDELARSGELRRLTEKWRLPYLLP